MIDGRHVERRGIRLLLTVLKSVEEVVKKLRDISGSMSVGRDIERARALTDNDACTACHQCPIK